jgi:hypothetical protein
VTIAQVLTACFELFSQVVTGGGVFVCVQRCGGVYFDTLCTHNSSF